MYHAKKKFKSQAHLSLRTEKIWKVHDKTHPVCAKSLVPKMKTLTLYLISWTEQKRRRNKPAERQLNGLTS
jgi:hypothetical protein